MLTDGKWLLISAHDGARNVKIEHMVHEAYHQRLCSEARGDYARIARWLRVENDKLFLSDDISRPATAMSTTEDESSRTTRIFVSAASVEDEEWNLRKRCR